MIDKRHTGRIVGNGHELIAPFVAAVKRPCWHGAQRCCRRAPYTSLAVCCIEWPVAALLCGTERALDRIAPARKVLLAALGGHVGKEGPNNLGILLQLF